MSGRAKACQPGKAAATPRSTAKAKPRSSVPAIRRARNSSALAAAARAIGAQLKTGTVFMNRCDYLDPALCWTGCKDTGRGAALSELGYHALTRAKS